MADEIAANHSDPAGSLLSEFLVRQSDADQKLDADPHAAVKDAVQVALGLAIGAAKYVPCDYPGAALRHLLAALDDRDRGIVDAVLQPKPENKHGGNYLSLMAKLERVPLVLAMKLLMQAGRKRDEAAKEVVQLLSNRRAIFKGHDGSPWRLVARWRDELGEDPDLKKMVNECVTEIIASLEARGETADALVRMARLALNCYG